MKLAIQVLHGHFGPEYLLEVGKNVDEKHCCLKYFGLSKNQVSFFKPKFIKTIRPTTGAEFSNSKVYSNFAWISIAM